MTQQPDFDLTVIVPTRNRATILAKCLTSLCGQIFDTGEYEILVVDDGSTDSTPDVVQSLQSASESPPIRHHRRPHQGLNATRNAGVRHARGRLLAFIDDDELVPPDYLRRACKALEENPEVSGIGGPYRDHSETPLRTCRRCSLGKVEISGEGIRLVPRLLGGNMVLRRSAFEEVGLFDDSLSGRGDENEWFHRAAGLKFFYNPDLWVWHRRDHLSLGALWRQNFRQGLSIPEAQRLMGASWRPRPLLAVRLFGHAAFRLCAHGIARGARELGATWAWLSRRGARS